MGRRQRADAGTAGRQTIYCPDPWLAPLLRSAAPGARLVRQWDEFVAGYGAVDLAVVVVRDAGEASRLASALAAPRHQHPLTALIVIAELDATHVLPFRRLAVDEFVDLGAIGRTLGGAAHRALLVTLRERLALFFEQYARTGAPLRLALTEALRRPADLWTVKGLAGRARVTPRTLQNQWKAYAAAPVIGRPGAPVGSARPAEADRATGSQRALRLEDVVWAGRLLRALELRTERVSVQHVARQLRVDLRSLQRASKRLLGRPLGALDGAALASTALWLRDRIIGR